MSSSLTVIAAVVLVISAHAQPGPALPVVFAGEALLHLSHPGAIASVQERVAAVQAALERAVAQCTQPGAAFVHLLPAGDCIVLSTADVEILRVCPSDLGPGDHSLMRLAGRWQVEIEAALLKAIPPVLDLSAQSDAVGGSPTSTVVAPPSQADPNRTDGTVVDIMLSSGVIARIRACGDAPSVRQRAATIDARLTDIISSENCARPDVRIVTEAGVPAIYVGTRLLMHVYPADAEPNRCTPEQLAAVWRRNLLQWLPRAASMAARPDPAATAHTTRDPIIGDAGRATLSPAAYTGLIIDATSLGAIPCISPRIVAPDGHELWGTVPCSAAFALSPGIAAWTQTIDDARRSERAGENPLIIRAIAVSGSARCAIGLSSRDARRIRAANRIAGFLSHCNVVIVH